MKLKTLLVSSLLALSLSVPAFAENSSASELASPILALMPAVIEIRDELKLDEKQNKTIDAWLAAAPAKRKELGNTVVAIRAELREALINRDSRVKRDEIKQRLNEANTRLIELSSLCARMLHNTMTKEQYAKIVAQYKKAS